MKNTIIAQVANMTVAEMRKAATQHGIKNASRHKRVELEEMLINAMLIETKNAKAASEKSKASTETIKRYKATKIAEDDIVVQADEIIANNVTFGLFDVHRKVLIEVMKKLNCDKWYRIYDKPTMVDKIKTTLLAA